MRVDPVDGLVRVELLVRTASQGVKIRGKMSAVPEGVDHIGKTEDSCDFTIWLTFGYRFPVHFQGVPRCVWLFFWRQQIDTWASLSILCRRTQSSACSRMFRTTQRERFSVSTRMFRMTQTECSSISNCTDSQHVHVNHDKTMHLQTKASLSRKPLLYTSRNSLRILGMISVASLLFLILSRYVQKCSNKNCSRVPPLRHPCQWISRMLTDQEATKPEAMTESSDVNCTCKYPVVEV